MILNKIKLQIVYKPVENFKNFEIHPYFICRPASLPACDKIHYSDRRIGPVFSHNTEYQCAITDLLFGLRFIHCTMVSPFILHLVNEKMRNHWRGVNELYGLYLLHHANGQIHICLIASFVKIITKCMHCVFAVYWFKSARMVSYWDLYACSWEFG